MDILSNKGVTVLQRNNSLDVLRGIAILLMVLSSSISFGNLPAWMYHAQVPPPKHVFDPTLAGITWVDLVFPFFLFTMGAAIPLAMTKKVATLRPLAVFGTIAKRFVALFFFALFSFYMRAWVMTDSPGGGEYLLSIIGFAVLFALYTDFKTFFSARITKMIHASALLFALGILYFIYAGDARFTFEKTDIIILVLANMALFGTLWWWLTARSYWLRIGILPFIMAVFLGAKELGSINAFIFNLSPATWLYQFYYLKYLFIILPATVVGEWIYMEAKVQDKALLDKKQLVFQMILCMILIGTNVFNLYMRYLVVNLLITLFLSVVLYRVVNVSEQGNASKLHGRLVSLGGYLLLLGLIFEAYEGGIKKDYSTYSYYFVCTGLACYALNFLSCMEQLNVASVPLRAIALVGKNPMIAYTAGNLVLIPSLAITGLQVYLDQLGAQGGIGGVFRGILFTGTVAVLTMLSSRLKLYWKT